MSKDGATQSLSFYVMLANLDLASKLISAQTMFTLMPQEIGHSALLNDL
jgi:hypothetical protein